MSSIPFEANEKGFEEINVDIPVSKVNYGGTAVSRNSIMRDSQYAGTDSKAQTYKYEPSQLKSVIFGIKTSITDRAAIMDAVKKAYGSLDKVQWKQAEYDEISQKIRVSSIVFAAK